MNYEPGELPSYEVGERVACVDKIQHNQLVLYGWGIYVGNCVDAISGLIRGRIVLDNDLVMYTDECYCLTEEEVMNLALDEELEVIVTGK